MIPKKQLDKMTDLEVAAAFLQEKLDKLPNPNTPTAARLRMTISHINELNTREKTRPAGWWFIQFYDAENQRLLPQEMDEAELDRIGQLVQVGFGSGEIVQFKRREGGSDD